jgi:hypothetical protein
VRHLATLHALWPRAKFVHLIRDGRDVALSVLSWSHANRTAGKYATWAEDPVTTTALWWRRKVLSGREGGRLLGADLYYELGYERLVAHPDEECASLCAFLGVRDEPAMLRFHEERTRHHPGKKAWLPITPGLRDWRRQMDPEAVTRFEAAAGDLLDDLGYPRAYPRPSAEALRHATTIANAFACAALSPPGALREIAAGARDASPALAEALPASGLVAECREVQ